MILNDAGRMVENIWQDIPNKYSGFENDIFVVMPNHLHGILIISEKTAALSLPDVIRNFKSFTTTCYMRGVEENKLQPFEKKFWQRNYYEHIIRKNEDLDKIRQYIVDNPKNWDQDQENSA